MVRGEVSGLANRSSGPDGVARRFPRASSVESLEHSGRSARSSQRYLCAPELAARGIRSPSLKNDHSFFFSQFIVHHNIAYLPAHYETQSRSMKYAHRKTIYVNYSHPVICLQPIS